MYIQARKTAYLQCDLYRYGLRTQTDFIEGKNILYRNFKNNNTAIRIYVVPDNCSKNEWIEDYFKTASSAVIYSSSYSNEILKLLKNEGNKIEVLGPFTVLNKQKHKVND